MAKNWQAKEMAKVLLSKPNNDQIDMARRFPLACTLFLKGEKGLTELISVLPEHITVRKIESGIKEMYKLENVEATEDEDEIPTPKAAEKPVKKAKPIVEEDEDEDEDEEPVKPVKKAKFVEQPKRKAKPVVIYEDEEEDEDEEEEPVKPVKKGVKVQPIPSKPAKKAKPVDDDEWDD